MVSSAKSIQAPVINSVPGGWMQSYQLSGRADSEPITSTAALARASQQVEGGDVPSALVRTYLEFYDQIGVPKYNKPGQMEESLKKNSLK